MKEHPEQLENELFVGNIPVTDGVFIPTHYSFLQTARLGEMAYDIHGKQIDPSYCRPLFIDKSEERKQDEIYMQRVKAINRLENY